MTREASVKPLWPLCIEGCCGETFFVGYVDGLIMKHHADDVKARFGVGETEIPRLVYEYAQYRCTHDVLLKKREWRDGNPATHAESFPRIPVTPSTRKRSTSIVAHSRTARKGVR